MTNYLDILLFLYSSVHVDPSMLAAAEAGADAVDAATDALSGTTAQVRLMTVSYYFKFKHHFNQFITIIASLLSGLWLPVRKVPS
jgi:pyruvate carboxylase